MPRLTHDQVWTAIDALALRYGFSASGLAKKSGLDATSFNKSKRVAPDGHLRWPSTESVAKVLEATGASVEEFIALLANSSLADAYALSERLRQAVADASFGSLGEGGGARFQVTASFGVASAAAVTIENIGAFFLSADQALYRAKASGRNCVMG